MLEFLVGFVIAAIFVLIGSFFFLFTSSGVLKRKISNLIFSGKLVDKKLSSTQQEN
jgi:hypothetical protein